MRPEILIPLFAETDGLDGIGPKLKKPLEKLDLRRVRDVLYHLPERFVVRRAVTDLDDANVGEQVVVALEVAGHRASRSPRGPYRVMATDAKGNVCAITYFGRASYTGKKQLPVGAKRWVAGRLDQYDQMLQIVHPDHVAEKSEQAMGQMVEPVYRLSEGLTQPRVASLVEQSLARAPDLPEWIEPSTFRREGWPSWREAIAEAHKGENAKARDLVDAALLRTR